MSMPPAPEPTSEHSYRALVERTRSLIADCVPAEAKVLVVTRGDENLLRLRGRKAAHFPQSETGLYAGYHPVDGGEAAAQLAALQARGAEYLAIPATSRWWLEYYPELRARLAQHGELVADEPDTCIVFALSRPALPRTRTPEELDAAATAPQVEALIDAVLPDEAGLVLVGPAANEVRSGRRRCWRLPGPGGDVTVEHVLAEAEAACRAGARYVLLLNPDDPTRAMDGRLRGRLARSLRLVFSQGLVEAFEAGPAEGVFSSG